jgi:RNA-directed DNA polymerase
MSKNLVEKMKRQAYKPMPVKRVFIPKDGTNKLRPLGIPAYEDKLVQSVLNKILNAIYEQEFLDCSYGFRPGRSCHDALKTLDNVIGSKKVSYVVDADIKGFFDNVNHAWLMKFLGERIEDPNILRLISRFLKAEIMENGELLDSDLGTPQGGLISPTLGNLYLHYVLDLWFEKRIREESRGEAYIIRYCDDFICCFQYKEDAMNFYDKLIKRLGEFNLEVAEDKTKIIEFGRFAEENRENRGEGKPEAFYFLGFTHYCSKSRKGKFIINKKTSKKKFKAKLQKSKAWLKKNMHEPIGNIIKSLNAKLIGHFRYYGITGNSSMINSFKYRVTKQLFWVLNRRSQRRSYNWDKFLRMLKIYPIAKAKIYVNMYA